ncbi:MAG: hypothetical protein JSV61_12380 [Anaerolineales bacterium]|nr:MAG: hypothetical protein JSV61_12380 [Anaerolineales bacterium]
MKIVTNERLIRRNTRIAQIASFSGLLVLISGLIISFTRQELISISFAALLVGFLLSQVGIYFTNRWGRRPRPDELLNQALKGFDNKYSIYHYITPASHLFVGPAGIWVILTRHQRGTISYSKGRWRMKGGGIIQSYLRIFAQENLGRPDLELMNEVSNIQKYLGERLPDGNVPPIDTVLVFLNDNAEIIISDEDNPAAPTLKINKLKEFLRKAAKRKPVSTDKVNEIQEMLPAEAV